VCLLPRVFSSEVDTEFLDALTVYAVHGEGDVKRLSGREGFRLRVGAHRVIFDQDAATILAVYVGRRATPTYKKN
jgi:mRNA interferase RelE/StbE